MYFANSRRELETRLRLLDGNQLIADIQVRTRPIHQGHLIGLRQQDATSANAGHRRIVAQPQGCVRTILASLQRSSKLSLPKVENELKINLHAITKPARRNYETICFCILSTPLLKQISTKTRSCRVACSCGLCLQKLHILTTRAGSLRSDSRSKRIGIWVPISCMMNLPPEMDLILQSTRNVCRTSKMNFGGIVIKFKFRMMPHNMITFCLAQSESFIII